MKIYAGVVLYNPDLQRLEENISSIANQVDKVVLFDNGSANQEAIIGIYEGVDNIHILSIPENAGIAVALNGIMRFAIQEGVQWVLTLDHDTVCGPGLIEGFIPYTQDDETALICPFIRDRNRLDYAAPIPSGLPDCEYDDCCITSGSLTRVSAVEGIGFFDERLFIDEVDTEFCERLRLSGYRILRVNTVYILHELGRMSPVYIFPRVGKAFNISYFKRPKYTSNHSNFRKYYIVRNHIYLFRKYKQYGKKGKKIEFLKTVAMWYIAEKDFLGKTKAVCKGIFDGLRMKVEH